MTTPLDKASARQLVEPFYRAFATGDLTLLDAVFTPDWRDNTLPPGRAPGLTGLKNAVAFTRSILPDVTATMEDVFAADGKVVVRIVFQGTNTGGFMGVGPNGKPVKFIAFDMHRVENGKVVESWHLEDNLALMIQLGVVPPIG